MIHAASTEERERLLADFVRFCEIESPSGRERAMADALTEDLRGLGLEVEEDDSGPETGSDAGNLLARIPGPEGAPTVLLCAHMDTVPLDGPVEVVSENGLLTNRHDAILGADNKAAVATILGAARRILRDAAGGSAGSPPVGVELLFTTSEEMALGGAKAFDRTRLRADFGYVFDHASPIGEIVLASPTYYSLEARFRGQAAHAGIRPEAGHNAIAAASRAIAAMRIGRLDDETTANVGRIQGGTNANVVAERCTVELEARSLDEGRAGEVVSAMVDALAEAASDAECDVETSVERRFQGYRLPRTAPAVQVAAAALADRGIEPVYINTGGGSDANALIPAGLPVVNLANGTERNHQPDESVTVEALDTMLDVTLAIVARAGR
ncbi:MAG TPA: M20/M25/M40 family metallo-hydrolase [Thermoleophilaceae bacterium]|nr:M20/M25/M40 family metallo-hydrolase [Thermoleophilaceae bacterium]